MKLNEIIILGFVFVFIACNEESDLKKRKNNLDKNSNEIDSLQNVVDKDFEALDSLEKSFEK
jgi:uncharacterized membrane-anchored protein YhcB (DUF1043 family)